MLVLKRGKRGSSGEKFYGLNGILAGFRGSFRTMAWELGSCMKSSLGLKRKWENWLKAFLFIEVS